MCVASFLSDHIQLSIAAIIYCYLYILLELCCENFVCSLIEVERKFLLTRRDIFVVATISRR
jgi:hypothetical protein